MKRFRGAISIIGDPEIYQVPTNDFEVPVLAVSVASGGVTASTSPIKEVSYLDPVINVPVNNVLTPVKPVFTPLPVETYIPIEPVKEIVFIDPVLDVPIVSPTLKEVLLSKPLIVSEPIIAPSQVIAEPIKEVSYLDPVINVPAVKSTIPIVPIEDEPITLNEANKSLDTPGVVTPSNNSSVVTPTVVEKVVDTINKAVDEIFKTEVTKDNAVVKDNTGLYLAGAVVGLGVLALIFKK
jgi:hypothetical protein